MVELLEKLLPNSVYTLLFVVLTGLVLPSAAFGDSIIELAVSDDVGSPAVLGELIVLDESGSAVEPQRLGRRWLLPIEFSDQQIVRRLSVTWANVPDPTKALPSITFSIPYFASGRFRLLVAPPAAIEPGADAALDVWGTSVPGMADQELFDFTMRARTIAVARTGYFTDRPVEARPLDAYSVFKFVEGWLALSAVRVVPSGDVIKAAEWLRRVASQHPSTFRANGLAQNALDLVALVDAAEGKMISQLWRTIIAETSCEDRRPKLLALRSLILDLPSERARRRVWEVMQIGMGHIESALAQCATQLAKTAMGSNDDNLKQQAIMQIEAQIRAISREMGLPADGRPAFPSLASDRAVLEDLLVSLRGENSA